MGDAASKGTGGGIVSVNTHGPAKFIGPGSFDVKIEGKNVQYLGDPMLNNCGPSGNPTNAATLAGVIQAPQDLIDEVGKERAEEICKSVCKNFQPGGARGPGVTRDFSKDDWPLFSAKEPFDILSEVTQVMPGSLNNNTKEFSPIMSRTGRCVGGPGGPPGAPLAHGSVVRSMGVTSRSKGSTVRWDLTVLKNAAETPTQDNISAWVEVKGDKEKLTVNQRKAKAMLKQIKGDKPKLIVVTPKKCGCPEKKSKGA
jgi:hypothetical protein